MFIWILIAVAICWLNVVFLGRALLAILNVGKRASFVDSFATGLIVTCSVFFFSSSAGVDQNFSAIVFLVTSAALVSFSYWRLYRENGLNLSIAMDRSTIAKAMLGLFIALLATVSALSHSLGYDDVTHLDYLIDVGKGSPFPVYRPLFGGWEIARYPMFGIVISGLGSHSPGGALFLYYLFGILILSALCLKLFDILECRGLSILQSLGATGIIFGVLSLGLADYDSFLNFATYPFQGARLILILGSIYLFFEWPNQQERKSVVIGLGLILVGSLWHPNSVIISFLYVATFLVIAFATAPRSKITFILKLYGACLVTAVFCFTSPNPIIRPSVGATNNEIIHTNIITTVSVVEDTSTEIDKPVVEKFLSDFFAPLSHRYYSRVWPLTEYIKRIGWLFLIIPLFLFFLMRFNLLRLGSIYIIISALMVGTQLLLTLPKQAIGSMINSGTYWMLVDLAPSIKHVNRRNTSFTDSYTALYLNHLGFMDVRNLEYGAQVSLFAPISPPHIRYQTASLVSASRQATFLLNNRYWRNPSDPPWPFSPWSIDRHDNSPLAKVRSYRGLNDIREYFLEAGLGLYAAMTSPATPIRNVEQFASFGQALYPTLDSTIIYRDIAIVSLQNTDTHSWFEISLNGAGYNADIMSIVDQNHVPVIVPSKECSDNLGSSPYIDLTDTSCHNWVWSEKITKSSKNEPLAWQKTAQYRRDHGTVRIFVPPLNQPVFLVLNLVDGRFGGLGEIQRVDTTLIDCDLKVFSKPYRRRTMIRYATCKDERAFMFFGPHHLNSVQH